MRLRRFLTALVCLSTLAFAQNVVAGTSISEPSDVVVDAVKARPVDMDAMRVGGEVPKPSTMMLFVCGLAGLTAAGGRAAPDEGDQP